jgi:hypothetical protein
MRSIKQGCLERIIFFGEKPLQNAVSSYLAHYHQERNHQGLKNQLLQPGKEVGCGTSDIACRERRGGCSVITTDNKLPDLPIQKWRRATHRGIRYVQVTAHFFIIKAGMLSRRWETRCRSITSQQKPHVFTNSNPQREMNLLNVRVS